jgi:hypothetical protein
MLPDFSLLIKNRPLVAAAWQAVAKVRRIPRGSIIKKELEKATAGHLSRNYQK